MKYHVTRSDDLPEPGSFRYPFVFGTGDIVIELTCDVNITALSTFVFFNPIKSVQIVTNGFNCVIAGYGIIFKDIDYVSVNGVTFYNFIGDGIQLNNVPIFSIKNNSFVGHVPKSDEAISIVKGAGSEGGDISWNLFSKVNKGILCGTGDAGDGELDSKQTINIHHNWFYTFERRAPYCRWGKFNVYNNLFDKWHYKGEQTFCIWSEDSATVNLLNNSFKQFPYSIFDGFPKKQLSWLTKRPWGMEQGAIARLKGKIFHSGNVSDSSFVKIEGEEFSGAVTFPEFEPYSLEMVRNIQAKAGSGLTP